MLDRSWTKLVFDDTDWENLSTAGSFAGNIQTQLSFFGGCKEKDQAELRAAAHRRKVFELLNVSCQHSEEQPL